MLVGVIEDWEYSIDEYTVKSITPRKIDGINTIKVEYKDSTKMLPDFFDKILIK